MMVLPGRARCLGLGGTEEQTQHVFSYRSPEQRMPAAYPRRGVCALTDSALRSISLQLAQLQSTTGCTPIRPEQLLRALLLQVLYTVRGEPFPMLGLEVLIVARRDLFCSSALLRCHSVRDVLVKVASTGPCLNSTVTRR